MPREIKISDMVPGGIKPTDKWHRITDDGTCSRCRKIPHEDDVPLLLWQNNGHDMLRYCELCLGGRPSYLEDAESIASEEEGNQRTLADVIGAGDEQPEHWQILIDGEPEAVALSEHEAYVLRAEIAAEFKNPEIVTIKHVEACEQ